MSKNNTIYYYHGDWKEAIKTRQIFETNFSYSRGIGEVIREKQHRLEVNKINGEARNGLMLLIKADKEANYSNLVNVLDEVMINQVKKYGVIKLSQPESNFLKEKQE